MYKSFNCISARRNVGNGFNVVILKSTLTHFYARTFMGKNAPTKGQRLVCDFLLESQRRFCFIVFYFYIYKKNSVYACLLTHATTLFLPLLWSSRNACSRSVWLLWNANGVLTIFSCDLKLPQWPRGSSRAQTEGWTWQWSWSHAESAPPAGRAGGAHKLAGRGWSLVRSMCIFFRQHYNWSILCR